MWELALILEYYSLYLLRQQLQRYVPRATPRQRELTDERLSRSRSSLTFFFWNKDSSRGAESWIKWKKKKKAPHSLEKCPSEHCEHRRCRFLWPNGDTDNAALSGQSIIDLGPLKSFNAKRSFIVFASPTNVAIFLFFFFFFFIHENFCLPAVSRRSE